MARIGFLSVAVFAVVSAILTQQGMLRNILFRQMNTQIESRNKLTTNPKVFSQNV